MSNGTVCKLKTANKPAAVCSLLEVKVCTDTLTSGQFTCTTFAHMKFPRNYNADKYLQRH